MPILSPVEILIRRQADADLKEQRKHTIKLLIKAFASNGTILEDKSVVNDLIKQLDPPDVCEHGRSIGSGCITCEEIDTEVYPEDYAVCYGCQEPYRTEYMAGHSKECKKR